MTWLKKAWQQEKFHDALCKLEIIWRFNLSKAPCWGGQYERLIGIFKSIFRKTVGGDLLSISELEETILDIEVCMNSRPLIYLEDDPQLPVMTLNSFLFQQPTHTHLACHGYFFPLKTVKLHSSDKPWMTAHLKNLIKPRQRAFHSGNINLWYHYRDKVRHAIRERKKKFYADKVKHMKKSDARSWWKLVKQLSGQSNNQTPIHVQKNGATLTDVQLVDTLNEFYTSVNADIPALDMNELSTFLPAAEQPPVIHPYQVCRKLQNLNPYKAMVPENIKPRMKEFAHTNWQSQSPISSTFQCRLVPFLTSGNARILLLNLKKHYQKRKEIYDQSFFKTSCISKVMEEFVAEWILEDIAHKIDYTQFGIIKGTSTNLCLLDMFNNWLLNLDTTGQYLRICFLNFSKAFDRINLNVLITKLVDLGVRRSLLPWICSFLSDRKQRVKLRKSFQIGSR